MKGGAHWCWGPDCAGKGQATGDGGTNAVQQTQSQGTNKQGQDVSQVQANKSNSDVAQTTIRGQNTTQQSAIQTDNSLTEVNNSVGQTQNTQTLQQLQPLLPSVPTNAHINTPSPTQNVNASASQHAAQQLTSGTVQPHTRPPWPKLNDNVDKQTGQTPAQSPARQSILGGTGKPKPLLLQPLIVVVSHDFEAYTSNTGIEPEVIMYNHQTPAQEVKERLLHVFEESLHLNRQVMIACSSQVFSGLRHINISEVVNDALDAFFEGKSRSVRLRHITILHHTNTLKKVVFNHGQQVRSITNVWFCVEVEKCLKGLNLVSAKVTNAACGAKQTVKLVRNGREFSHRRICELPSIQDLLEPHVESAWWYKLFKSVPRCAEGRNIQQAGTCWWDAIMNSLLLSQTAAEMMRMKWNALDPDEQEECKKVTLRMCPTETMSHAMFMCVLIYHILIVGDRARFLQPVRDDGTSWSLKDYQGTEQDIGLSIPGEQHIWFDAQHRTPIRNPQQGPRQDYIPGQGMKSNNIKVALEHIASILFDKHQYQLVHLIRSEIEHININASFSCTTQEDIIAHERRDPQNKGHWGELSVLKKRFSSFQDHPHPNIVILTDVNETSPVISSAPSSIQIDHTLYLLESAVILFPGHAVTGFICTAGGMREQFLFDSNNRLTADRWNEGDFSEYNETFPNNVDRAFKGFSYLLYGLPSEIQR